MSFDFILEDSVPWSELTALVGTRLSEAQAMALAIRAAYRGAPFVSPNPLVGSVLLNADHQLVQIGYHQAFGGPHAEVHALKGLSEDQVQGGTLFVTLEPCAHEGKTPSCAKMLAKTKLKKVIYGLVDPNPLVAGQGAQIVQQAGIICLSWDQLMKSQNPPTKEAGLLGIHSQLTTELNEVAEVFFKNFVQKQPFVSLKVATSMDGFLGLKNGQSQWLTNSGSRRHVHYLRACYQATAVSARTLLNDNALLNIRRTDLEKKNQVVIFDFRGDLFSQKEAIAKLSLWKEHSELDVFWILPESLKSQTITDFSAQIIYAECLLTGEFNFKSLFTQLFARGIKSVFVEGGGQLSSFLLQQNAVDRLYHYQAPVLIGAGNGMNWNQNMMILTMDSKVVLQNPKIRKIFAVDLENQALLPTPDMLVTARF